MTTKKDEQLRTAHNKKAVIESLIKSLGVVTSACKKAGVGRRTYYTWLSEDEEFRKEVEDIQDIALDFAESKLHKQINDDNIAAIIFYLKTKGKKRGYIERQEIDANIGKKDHSAWDEEKETAEEYCQRITSIK